MSPGVTWADFAPPPLSHPVMANENANAPTEVSAQTTADRHRTLVIFMIRTVAKIVREKAGTRGLASDRRVVAPAPTSLILEHGAVTLLELLSATAGARVIAPDLRSFPSHGLLHYARLHGSSSGLRGRRGAAGSGRPSAPRG